MPTPLPNSIAALAPDLTAWRRDLHAHPELGYAEHRTAARVAALLGEFGLDAVETGVGRTGVVGVLHGARGPGGPAILLRADMDALPMTEATGATHASTTPGVMHACGHDGHTAMLLGAARHLAQTRAFDGTIVFCFQPAEEGGAGARAMIEDGLLDRHRPRAVYGLHNWPGLPVGHFAVSPGPILAAADEFTITVTGRGGHAAAPHLTRDPIVAAAQIVLALQTIVARVVDPLAAAVVSITQFHAGTTNNVIPGTAVLSGTTRSFSPQVQAVIDAEIDRMAAQTAAAHGVEARVERSPVAYPPTLNDAAQAEFVARVMTRQFGADRVVLGHAPSLAAEDFSFLANAVPGCFVLIGNGASAPLHHPAYDFDDAVAPIGVAYWAALAQAALPLG